MKLLLLPGMDGTGILFNPLLKVLSNIEVQTICLNDLKGKTFKEQALEISSLVGSEELIILSESYSGYIAYELSLLPKLNIKHIIFAASFLQNPTWLSRFHHLLPLSIIRSKIIPRFVLSYILFSKNNDRELVNLFYSALKQVNNKTLRIRLNNIARMTKPSITINIPSTYIQANNDYLVSNNSKVIFMNLCKNLKFVKADGGHFIVQSSPLLFSTLIQDIISTAILTNHNSLRQKKC